MGLCFWSQFAKGWSLNEPVIPLDVWIFLKVSQSVISSTIPKRNSIDIMLRRLSSCVANSTGHIFPVGWEFCVGTSFVNIHVKHLPLASPVGRQVNVTSLRSRWFCNHNLSIILTSCMTIISCLRSSPTYHETLNNSQTNILHDMYKQYTAWYVPYPVSYLTMVW